MTRTLILHIGLPKTATTFLQHMIFKEAFGRGFIHRTRGERPKRICRRLKQLGTAGAAESKALHCKLRAELGSYCKRLPDYSGVAVSDENICGRALEFWDGQGTGPARLAEQIAELGPVLADLFGTIKVIIGIRRQDRWLASRYAESSTGFTHFNQADFDRRIAEISRLDSLGPVFDWLDYEKVKMLFLAALGTSNLLLLPMERLRAEPDQTMRELGEFVLCPDLKTVYDRLVKEDTRLMRNTLSAGGDAWRLRRDNSTLHLKPELQQALLGRVSESNQNLNRITPLFFD